MTYSDIAANVTPQELTEILQTLVRAPSINPPGDTRECADRMAALFQKEGIPVEKAPASDRLINVVARLKGRGPGKTVWFNGHMDVVPAGADWKWDPWGAELVDGRIYGRGTSDDKGGLSAMIGTMFALKRAGCPFDGEILFTAVADEETGSENGTIWLIENRKLSADYAIVGEPTRDNVEIGNRGTLWVEVTVKGRASHAGRPHFGINAVHNAAQATVALTKLEFPNRDERFEVPNGSVSVTMIEGGTKINTLADRCLLSIDLRMMPSDDPQEAIEKIRRTVASALDEGADFELKVLKVWPAVMEDPEHLLVRTVAKAFEEVHGQPPKIQAKAGGTDASFIKAMTGTPIVLFGPGASDRVHVANEYLLVDELVDACRVYTLAALELLG